MHHNDYHTTILEESQMLSVKILYHKKTIITECIMLFRLPEMYTLNQNMASKPHPFPVKNKFDIEPN